MTNQPSIRVKDQTAGFILGAFLVAVPMLMLWRPWNSPAFPPAALPATATDATTGPSTKEFDYKHAAFEDCTVDKVYQCSNGKAYITTDSGVWFADGKNIYRLREDESDDITRIDTAIRAIETQPSVGATK